VAVSVVVVDTVLTDRSAAHLPAVIETDDASLTVLNVALDAEFTLAAVGRHTLTALVVWVAVRRSVWAIGSVAVDADHTVR